MVPRWVARSANCWCIESDKEDICTGFYNCLFNIEFSIHLINLLLNKVWCFSTPPIAKRSFRNKILISRMNLFLLENEDAYIA